MRTSVVINCQAFARCPFSLSLQQRARPEALLAGDGLIREHDQGGNVMIMHFSSFYLDLCWGLPLSLAPL